MDLTAYLNQERGRGAKLARHLNVKPVNISRWRKKQKLVPTRYCLRIESWSAGVVTRQELRPDDWREHWGDPAAAAALPADTGDAVEPAEEVSHVS